MASAIGTGAEGEERAVAWLQARGFELLGRNERVGRYELDIVARRGSLLVFCEVKTARRDARIAPHERLLPEQQRRLRLAAMGWLAEHPQPSVRDLRFDAAFVELGDNGADVDYFEDAF